MYLDTLPPMNTDEDILAIIKASYKEPAQTAVIGIYKIFRAEAQDDEKPIMTWLKTCNHILDLLQQGKENK